MAANPFDPYGDEAPVDPTAQRKALLGQMAPGDTLAMGPGMGAGPSTTGGGGDTLAFGPGMDAGPSTTGGGGDTLAFGPGMGAGPSTTGPSVPGGEKPAPTGPVGAPLPFGGNEGGGKPRELGPLSGGGERQDLGGGGFAFASGDMGDWENPGVVGPGPITKMPVSPGTETKPTPTGPLTDGGQPSYEDFYRDYWAPDREAVLAQMRSAGATVREGSQMTGPAAGGEISPPNGPMGPGGTAPPPGTKGLNPLGAWKNTEDTWMAWAGQHGFGGTGRGGKTVTAAEIPNLLAQYNQQTGQHATYIGGPSGDKVDFHDGQGPVDVLTAGGQLWYDEGAKGSQPGGASFGQPAGAGGGGGAPAGGGNIFKPPPIVEIPGGGGQPPPGVPPGQPPPLAPHQPSAVEQAMRAQLMKQMEEGGKPVDTESANFQAQYLPIRNALERSALAQRGQAAERAAAEGSSFGGRGTGGEAASIQEHLGGQEASALGGVLTQELGAKRQQLSQALQLANSIGAREQAATIQQQLAGLENQYRYAQMGQQESQFARTLAQRESELGRQLTLEERRLLQQESQFGRGLGFQESQWNDTYGLRRKQMENEENRAAYFGAEGLRG